MWAKVALLASLVIAIDVATKAMVAGSYEVGERGQFLFLPIVHVRNFGNSMLFQQLGLTDGSIRLSLPVILTVGVLGGAALATRIRETDSPLVWLPAAVLLGGVIGNVSELFYRGYVTDFIYISALGASGNVADLGLFSGLLALLSIEIGLLAIYFGLALLRLGRRYRRATSE